MLKPKEKEAVAKTAKADVIPLRRPHDMMTRWEEEMGHWLEDFWRRPLPSLWNLERMMPRAPLGMRMPAVDLFEEPEAVVVKAELPGMAKEEIEITLTDHTLMLKGEKKREEQTKEKDYTVMERSYGSFVRAIGLPCEVKAEQVKATFKDGVLEVRMPKSEEAKRRSVTVKVE